MFALFDARIGADPLDPALVVYTDMNDQPDPQPIATVSDLIAARTRVIVVVDNCAPDLHRRLTELCRGADSLVSAITVEYDVQDDEPEGTEVFRLEPSSVALVASLIKRRFPALTDLDVDKIADFSGGNARVALVLANILSMRLHSDNDQKIEHAGELIDTGRLLLARPSLTDRDHNLDFHLRKVVRACLPGPDGVDAARALCEYMKKGFSDYSLSAYSWRQLLQGLFKTQPRVALEVFLSSTPQPEGSTLDIGDFDSPSDRRKNPLDEIPTDELLRWCEEEPARRYPAAARAISYFKSEKDAPLEWTPLAKEMLKRAPDRVGILSIFVDRFSPSSWSGSRAAIVESRLILLEQLGDLSDASVSDFARQQLPVLSEQDAREREWENKRDSDRDERFE